MRRSVWQDSSILVGNVIQFLDIGEVNLGEALKAGGYSTLIQAILFNVNFVAGTPVMTENGIAAIEDIKPGDMVYSEDRATGEKGLKRVLRTFANTANELVHISIGEETISSTPSHPFYVANKG